MVFNTTTNIIEVYSHGTWEHIGIYAPNIPDFDHYNAASPNLNYENILEIVENINNLLN